ncbi:hypothetical protein FRAAL4989 [Frankia alni ACN14a]|uniref:Multi-ubiquitin domain-containing protein n=1 Tax=Frankia alni (strain DSM 45986 / CECT 9034 / ACN14a) TaxID=326424 RepID=Q0RFW0_FRAAA|nr:hypothetical protein FRAAL4989 [Frankia alni ACN14a]
MEAELARRPSGIPVTVNGQRVDLPDREVTGLEIKKAAVQQGVAIEVGFQLSVREGQRYRVIGDGDPIRVHPKQEFIAVAPDDNS